jgi:oxalate decarboxylase/phosphoglucose isomerase-like protein (cupin superfamily)
VHWIGHCIAEIGKHPLITVIITTRRHPIHAHLQAKRQRKLVASAVAQGGEDGDNSDFDLDAF